MQKKVDECFFFRSFSSIGQGEALESPSFSISPAALPRAGPWPAPPQRASPAAAPSPSSAPQRAKKEKSRLPLQRRRKKKLRREGRRERRRRRSISSSVRGEKQQRRRRHSCLFLSESASFFHKVLLARGLSRSASWCSTTGSARMRASLSATRSGRKKREREKEKNETFSDGKRPTETKRESAKANEKRQKKLERSFSSSLPLLSFLSATNSLPLNFSPPLWPPPSPPRPPPASSRRAVRYARLSCRWRGTERPRAGEKAIDCRLSSSLGLICSLVSQPRKKKETLIEPRFS